MLEISIGTHQVYRCVNRGEGKDLTEGKQQIAAHDQGEEKPLTRRRLADLATAIASTGASIKQVSHERAFGEADVSKVQVLCQIEVRGPDHCEEVFHALRASDIEVVARGGLRNIAAI